MKNINQTVAQISFPLKVQCEKQSDLYTYSKNVVQTQFIFKNVLWAEKKCYKIIQTNEERMLHLTVKQYIHLPCELSTVTHLKKG